MTEIISLIERYHEALLKGSLTSLELAAIAWVGGLLIGVLLGVWRASHRRGAKEAGINLFSLVASSIPVMVYLLWFHYPLQALLHLSIPPFFTAAVVFTLYNALTIGEIVRAAISDLPVAFAQVARATGVPRRIYVRYVMVPLALRAALPNYLVSQVVVLHATLFASLISVDELFRVTQRINALEYNAVGVFSLLALFYFVLSFPLLIVSRLADQKLAKLGLDR